MERMRSLIVAPVAVAALLTVGVAVPAVASPALASPALASPTAAGPASAALPCHASMSNNRPRDYTTTYVRVRTAAYASVTTVAHYRTTNHKKTGKAGLHGNASIGYYISGATPGYRVVVSVHVAHDGRSGNCSTWFTPHR
jgi:hypothetical protein